MNVRERLKEAYESVSFSADRTWASVPTAFHACNLDLHLTEKVLQSQKLHRFRPRTVREAIPKSRLAQYVNCVYNESREMSYAANSALNETLAQSGEPTEAWEMPEVRELYKWFLKQPEDDFYRVDRRYESPLLNVKGFEDKILKIQITEDRVKNIWNSDFYQIGEPRIKNEQIIVNFFTSPMSNVFLFDNETGYDYEWFRHISLTKDFDQLEQLSTSFKDQINSIAKFMSSSNEPPPPSEPISTEILYSEVLQGLSPSRKLLSSFKCDHNNKDETSSTSQESFTNYTILNQKAGQEDGKQARHYKPSQVDSVQRNTRASVHPCVQQAYFYSPAVQRWSYYPTQVFTSSWVAQSPVVNRLFGASPVTIASESENQVEGEEHQVSTSISEELEIQALEQYSNSNENFYQELERQAAEQYANSPE
ncbi:uncharacterized protein LOC103313546 isoform X1 [Tribolium castaneum]|uniref:Uncharacterized protein n=2 Tax=Tribolium castaneum TaxID=7070 RepID=D6WRY8_TRICA|nr:PREDICTED: uncharacterized protein LOC103313546 isoform X1 [Tribolium castaneum]EFA06601.2 hypothetical protein TcasGA2_TC009516 [Tribolium castaneum]|eukprot:XP_008195270.1 PREDICTED: uncharacterized protein LOC103313546 isoform X1 [Tribolium castaneum]